MNETTRVKEEIVVNKAIVRVQAAHDTVRQEHVEIRRDDRMAERFDETVSIAPTG